jgi:hypothetical protein
VEGGTVVKTARILILSLILATTLLANLSAFDWGGTVDNSTTLYTLDGANLDQRVKLSIWLSNRFSDSTEFLALGSYTASLDDPFIFDLERLQVSFSITPEISVIVGRFLFAEFSGLVLNHPADGFWLTYSLPKAIIAAGVGYSGLQFNKTNQILMSQTDTSDADDTTRFLGSPRLIESIQATLPELFKRQDLIITLLSQQDLRPQTELLQKGEENLNAGGLLGGKLHTIYLGLGLSGPLSLLDGLYHNTFLYTETGATLSYVEDPASFTGFSYQYKPILAFLGGLNLDYYLEDRSYSAFGLSILFAGGDSDSSSFLEGNSAGLAMQFIPISRPSFGLIFSPQLGNTLLAELSYSVKPFSGSNSPILRNLQTELQFSNYLRPNASPISEIGLDPASEARYLGSEIDGTVRFRPFSDLGTLLSLGLFLPNKNAFSGTYAEPQFLGRFEFSFSF